ncbi:MAG: hypothetical protein ISEC1_P2068 [Thiomicrorhabdus sp.]|nr:MAG: hypothetical protein ISEC1_P2068 [Thiomicrorhabdus sp.]
MANLGLLVSCVGDGAYIADSAGTPVCVGGVWTQVPLDSMLANFSLSQIPPELIVGYFASGMMLYVTFLAFGFGVKAIFKIVN